MSGPHILHLLLQITGTILILHCVPVSRSHQLTFIWCFSYLTLFRLSSWLGLPEPPPHTNAILLILTLKLVGLAFECHDAELAGKPDLADIFHYSLGHIGLITGPYYKYSTWRGLYDDPWSPGQQPGWDWGICEAAALKRARNVPYYVAAFLLSSYLFPLSVVETEEWQEKTSLLWKIFYMMPIFFNFRMRIYAGFTLSECACIMAGLGAYPECSEPRPGQGPTRPTVLREADTDQLHQINFQTVHNIDEWGSDFVSVEPDPLVSNDNAAGAEYEGGSEVLEHDGPALAGFHCLQEVPSQEPEDRSGDAGVQCLARRTPGILSLTGLRPALSHGKIFSLFPFSYAPPRSRITTERSFGPDWQRRLRRLMTGSIGLSG